jgi:hypothetical protein
MAAETRIVEWDEMVIARHQLGKHVSAAMNAHATTKELLGHS